METSFMYHAFGIREQECTRTRYEGGKIVLEIRTREDKLYCAKCGSRHVIKSGSALRRLRCVPVGSRPIILEMTVQRLECKDCGAIQQEKIHFVQDKERYTYRMRLHVLDLCRIGTIADVARQVHMSWDTVKDILEADLGRRYSRPDLKGLRYIGIDEFAVAKGHVYMTIVVDLESGRIVYVGNGKGADALDGLWPKLARAGCRIEAVSTDLSEAFISAVREHLPDAVQIFDHFHIVKLMNEKLDKVRIDITCDRHMEYLELIDGRPSCVEPLSTEAGWRWNDGLRYYITVGNTDTRCYIDRLEKGRYWFEYEVYVTNPGTFLSGPVTMQCMYAPEFRATAPAQTLHIDPAR